MIHIIGTSHSLQVWTDAKRNGESLDARKETIEAFESYLAEVARSLKADVIGEEASEEWIAKFGPGASSVAKDVAGRLAITHLFCDPDTRQRRAMGLMVGEEMVSHATTVSGEVGGDWLAVHKAEIRKGFPAREAVWLERLERFKPNDISVVFVCGADHVDSFKAGLDAKKILARIRCREWKEGAEA
jgi:hypothetical protein